MRTQPYENAVSSPLVHPGTQTVSTSCHWPASVWKWTILPCTLQLAWVSAVSVRSRGCGKIVTIDGHWWLVSCILCAQGTTSGQMAWRMSYVWGVGASPELLRAWTQLLCVKSFFNISHLFFLSTILGTSSLNSADVPLAIHMLTFAQSYVQTSSIQVGSEDKEK